MKQLIYGCIVAFLLLGNACRPKANPANKTQTPSDSSQTMLMRLKAATTANPVHKKVYWVESKCAIIVQPTDKQIQQLRKQGQDAFDTVLDDCMYYLGESRTLLDSLHIRTVEIPADGELVCVLPGRIKTTVDLKNYYWKILLFNGKQAPVDADITAMGDACEKYMK